MATVNTSSETNLITQDKMKKVREIDFVRRFQHNSLAKLLEVLGVTRRIPMMEGTTLYYYKTTGELQDGSVPEGEIIPLSQYKTEKIPVGEITLKKWRKAASAEAIKKSGYEAAVRDTDAALLRDVQATVRGDLFDYMNGAIAGSTPVDGNGLQAALAAAWGQLQVKFEDDTAEPVYFVNPLDISEYLANANVTTQTVFGMNYIQDFLGLGTVIVSSRVAKGTFLATAKQNIIMYYLTMNGDIAATFGLTADELGFIGISSGNPNKERAQAETLVMCGIQIMVEYAEGVVKGTIGGSEGTLGTLTVSSAAGTASGTTKLTVTPAKASGNLYKYKAAASATPVTYGQNVQTWTAWDGAADITATTGQVVTVVECGSDYKAVASGSATVTAKA